MKGIQHSAYETREARLKAPRPQRVQLPTAAVLAFAGLFMVIAPAQGVVLEPRPSDPALGSDLHSDLAGTQGGIGSPDKEAARAGAKSPLDSIVWPELEELLTPKALDLELARGPSSESQDFSHGLLALGQ